MSPADVIATGRFFVPGPTEVRAAVLEEMRRPMIFHRTRDMEALMDRVTRRLGLLFGSRRDVHVLTASGTAAMELAIRCGTVARVLSVVHGDFGERFARMAESCGRNVTRLRAEPGDVVPLERIEEALRSGSYDAITITHSETATGTLADVAAMARVARDRSDCLVLVDAVSSAGAVAVEVDEWGIDAAVSASQKALALPPGLAFAAVSQRFVERAASLKGRGTYLDILRYEEFTAKRQSPTTPAIPLLYALDRQLSDIEQEGLPARFARHRAMAEACWTWTARIAAAGLALPIVAKVGSRSPSVTAFRSDSASAIRERMRAEGFTLGGGQGELTKSSFRIGHMGDHTVAGVNELLATLERVLRAI